MAFGHLTMEEVKKEIEGTKFAAILDFADMNNLSAIIPINNAGLYNSAANVWTYTYQITTDNHHGQFRAPWTKFEDTKSTTETQTFELDIFGGSFVMDRAIANLSTNDKKTLELQQFSGLIKGVQADFGYYLINGGQDVPGSAQKATSFKGLRDLVQETYNGKVAPRTGSLNLSVDPKSANDAAAALRGFDEVLRTVQGTNKVIIAGDAVLNQLLYLASVRNLNTTAYAGSGFSNYLDARVVSGGKDSHGRDVVKDNELFIVDLSPNGFHAASKEPVEGYNAGPWGIYPINWKQDSAAEQKQGQIEIVATGALPNPKYAYHFTDVVMPGSAGTAGSGTAKSA